MLLGVATWIAAYLQMACWSIVGENITKRIRQAYLAAILKQEIGWFDSQQTGDLTSRLIADTSIIQEGVSEKVGLVIQSLGTFVAGFILAFTKGWLLALVLCGVFPLLGVLAFSMSKLLASSGTAGQDSYGKAGAIAQQTLSSIRTVFAFNRQKSEIFKYNKEISQAEITVYFQITKN